MSLLNRHAFFLLAATSLACSSQAKLIDAAPDGSTGSDATSDPTVDAFEEEGAVADSSPDSPLADSAPDLNCIADAAYYPVCGVDGKTYDNWGAATCVGVAVWRDGPCCSDLSPHVGDQCPMSQDTAIECPDPADQQQNCLCTTGATWSCGTALCDPFGTWSLTYSGQSCSLAGESVTIEAGDAGSLAVVTFLNRTYHGDFCSFDGGMTDAAAGPVQVGAALSNHNCSVHVVYYQSYCYSGEQQCEGVELTLNIDGDQLNGTDQSTACWCAGPGPAITQFSVSGSRQ